MSKIFTVFGATGNQGGSVVAHILEHPKLSKEYKLRGVTRDVSRPAAIALQAKGVEMVSADLNDKESVKKAIQGSAVVFGVTNFWEKMSAEIEVSQGKNIVDACKETGVERFIWSSLPNVSKETHGKLTSVHHFDSKSHVEEYARASGIPCSFFMPGIFMSAGLGAFKKTDDGIYAYTTPWPGNTKVAFLAAAEDTGLFVAAILLHGSSTLGKRILGSSGYITPDEMVKGFTEVTGHKATINRITYQQLQDNLPPAAADELTGNFQLIEDPGYFVGEPADAVEKSIELCTSAGLRKPTPWNEFVKKNFKA